jgi:hypothetical protein
VGKAFAIRSGEMLAKLAEGQIQLTAHISGPEPGGGT